MRKFLFFAVFIFINVPCWAEEPIPGYRYPVETDYKGAWLEFRKEIPVPFHVQADFDGNGIADNGWILIKTDNSGWGLFVFMGRGESTPKIVKLYDDYNIDSLSNKGIGLVQPGIFETACGKGYWECEPGEPAQLKLFKPAIDFFQYESANSYFYWVEETKSFRQTWISD